MSRHRSAAHNRRRSRFSVATGIVLTVLTFLVLAGPAASALSIDSASWSNYRDRITVRGQGDENRDVTVVNAFDPNQVLGDDEVEDDGDWRVRSSDPSPVPCRVRAIQSNGETAERDVSNAPSDCAPKSGGNQAPVADANGPYSGTAGESVSFSSSGSNDPDGSIASYSWDFGDGGSSSQDNPSHTYASAGTYTVTLTVTDNDGASDSDTTTATIAPPPTGGDFEITSASWRFDDGDRRLTVRGNGTEDLIVTVVNAYDTSQFLDDDRVEEDGDWRARDRDPSPFPCRVRATQSDGQFDEMDVANAPADCAPKAPGGGNQAPVADANGPYTGTAGSPVSFDGTGSSDSDGTIVSYAWNFGDGGTGTGATPSHTYTAGGSYTVTLTVTDDGGATDSATSQATISDVPPPNVAPTADAGGPYTAQTGSPVSFDGTGSSDSDGTIVSYAWNFGDGGTGTGATPSHTYTAAGTYTVTLTVTDNDGATDSATTQATISDTPPPNVAPTADANGPYSGTVGSAVTFDGTGSSDSDGTIASYDWDFGDGNNGTGATPSHTYTAAGTYTVMLTVTDNDGASDTANSSATITDVTACPDPVTPPNVSINSTSVTSNCQPTTPVSEVSQVANNSYSVLAINDLGMHCGDLDTRISSILPPFQVLLGQVIQKGSTPTLNPGGITLRYSAASNPNDPSVGGPLNGQMADGSTYKTNFWNTVINTGVYNAFYPFDIDGMMTEDLGLPVPNVEELYIGADGVVNSGDESLVAVQHAMPGIASPYSDNAPQDVQEHFGDKPFFVNFPFGYVAENVNWHEAAGIPFAAFDDFGRENAYPLVRVEAVNGAGTTVSTVDTVLPISGEASCTNCHTTLDDYTSVHGSGADHRSNGPTNTLASNGLPVALSVDDPELDLPPKVSLEYAADINVLRLHDLSHGANYVTPTADGVATPDPCSIGGANGDNGTASCLTNKALVQGKPVVCQVCHYTPALDLAHVGPQTGPAGSGANGRNQLHHTSNSNVMHSHHGSTGLFTPIPAATQNASGVITNQSARLAALEESCYQCHPGKDTQCLRGAMFNGGMLCSDCHGDMQQVGADFSANVSPTNPGAFELTGNFYDPNDPQPRVPWANEPGCGSCHTGDASNNLAGTTGTMTNTRDSNDNLDGIRLRQAYRTGDAKATPIVPSNKRFAEPEVPASFNGTPNNGAGNPQLYRVSTGHGGVMCEGCHGATHAEWPNANPNANDNVTAEQLQGHVGTIADCTTCHSSSPGNSLNGPHGLHRIAFDSTPWSSSSVHRSPGNNYSNCATCHGGTGRNNSCGTVLSRVLADRNFSGNTILAGEPMGCAVCHNETYWNSTCVNQ